MLMGTKAEVEKHIEETISKTKCLKDFKCYKPGFKDLPKVKIMGSKTLIECFEENAEECEYSFHFGNSFFCKCPVLSHILKNLHILKNNSSKY